MNADMTNSGRLLQQPVRESIAIRFGTQVRGLLGARKSQSIAEQIGAYYHVVVQTISLKLPDDLLTQLTNEAKARRVTRSRVVRDSLEKALNEKPAAGPVSCYDLARDLAGSVKGLPRDLATNPKYMEDFGK